jgi:hypothetical protein
MDNTNFNQIQKKRDRHGENNPMWGRKHSDEARRKQSEAAKKRHQQYQQWKDSQAHITMDEFLGSQPMREYISSLIREQIDKMIWKE